MMFPLKIGAEAPIVYFKNAEKALSPVFTNRYVCAPKRGTVTEPKIVMPVPVVTGTVDDEPVLLSLQIVNSKAEPTFALGIAASSSVAVGNVTVNVASDAFLQTTKPTAT
jgi:hypothetical protein